MSYIPLNRDDFAGAMRVLWNCDDGATCVMHLRWMGANRDQIIAWLPGLIGVPVVGVLRALGLAGASRAGRVSASRQVRPH
jgi:hypothetical protein